MITKQQEKIWFLCEKHSLAETKCRRKLFQKLDNVRERKTRETENQKEKQSVRFVH